MSYEQMLEIIDEYLKSPELNDSQWILILSECRHLINEKLNKK